MSQPTVKSNECISAVTDELGKHGITYDVEPRGKHVAIVFVYGGIEYTHIAPASPSDWRAPMNSKSQIRRLLRDIGAIGEDDNAVTDRDIVRLSSGRIVCNSREIAANFGKQHKNVLRDIDELRSRVGDEFDRLNFEPVEYVDERGRNYRLFNLTRDGFSMLAMGFTGQDAIAWKIKYIAAFNAMEHELMAVSRSSLVDAKTLARIDRIEGDLAALIDLVLEGPKPEPGYIVIKAHKRRIRNYAGNGARQHG